jgi:hypothetical protein
MPIQPTPSLSSGSIQTLPAASVVTNSPRQATSGRFSNFPGFRSTLGLRLGVPLDLGPDRSFRESHFRALRFSVPAEPYSRYLSRLRHSRRGRVWRLLEVLRHHDGAMPESLSKPYGPSVARSAPPQMGNSVQKSRWCSWT